MDLCISFAMKISVKIEPRNITLTVSPTDKSELDFMCTYRIAVLVHLATIQ